MSTKQQVTTSQEQPNFGAAYFSKDEQYDPYEQFQRRAYSEMLPQTGMIGTRPYQRLEAAAMRQFNPAFGQWLLSQPAQTGGFGGASYTSGFEGNIPGAAPAAPTGISTQGTTTPTFGAWYDARQPTGDPYQAFQSLAALSGTYGPNVLTEAEEAARAQSPFLAYLDPSSREARAITSYMLGGPTRGYLGQLQQGRAQNLQNLFNRLRMQQGSSVYGMPAEMYFNWLQDVLPQGYGAGQEAAQGGYTGTPGSIIGSDFEPYRPRQGVDTATGIKPEIVGTPAPPIIAETGPIDFGPSNITTAPVEARLGGIKGQQGLLPPAVTPTPMPPAVTPTPMPPAVTPTLRAPVEARLGGIEGQQGLLPPAIGPTGFIEPHQRDQLLPVTAGAAAPTGGPYGGGIVDIPTGGVQPTPTMPATRITPTPTITEAPTPIEEAPITALPRTEGEIYQTWQRGGDDLAAIDELVGTGGYSEAEARETVARWAAIPGTGIGQTATPAPAPAPARVRGRLWSDLTQEQQNILRAMDSGYNVPLSRSPTGRMKAPAGASTALFQSTNPNDWVQWAIKTGMPYTP